MRARRRRARAGQSGLEEDREERGGILLVEVGDVAAGGGGEADGGVIAGVDVAALSVFVVAGDEDDGLARGVDPREGVHRAALDVAADADDVGLVDDRLRGGGGNVAVEVGEGGDFHLLGMPLRGGDSMDVVSEVPVRMRCMEMAWGISWKVVVQKDPLRDIR